MGDRDLPKDATRDAVKRKWKAEAHAAKKAYKAAEEAHDDEEDEAPATILLAAGGAAEEDPVEKAYAAFKELKSKLDRDLPKDATRDAVKRKWKAEEHAAKKAWKAAEEAHDDE